jgi:hypothetical protein
MRTTIILSILLIISAVSVYAQTELTMSGKTYTNSSDTWTGVDIPRSTPTILVFKNNSITAVNRVGYMLQAGDEAPSITSNNLDGANITGNKLVWNGSDMEVITHGIFTGHNSNVTIKYNYLDHVPMGIIRKSGNNMTNTGGGVAYNIVKGGAVAMVVKGMSNVNIFNNTFYSDRTNTQTWRPLLQIYENTDGGRNSAAHGMKIYNNIFYTKYRTFVITIDNESLTGLECDYNVYWSDAGPPVFNVGGIDKTFEEWQLMGYDLHSKVVNPQFVNLINFVPEAKLDFGKNLGPEWSNGLSAKAIWGTNDPVTTAQNENWQIGAVVRDPGTMQTESPGINIFPNPAQKFLFISNIEESPEPRTLRIYDLSGKLCLEKKLDNNPLQKIIIDLVPGIFILQILSGSRIEHKQKLVVIK